MRSILLIDTNHFYNNVYIYLKQNKTATPKLRRPILLLIENKSNIKNYIIVKPNINFVILSVLDILPDAARLCPGSGDRAGSSIQCGRQGSAAGYSERWNPRLRAPRKEPPVAVREMLRGSGS